MDSEQAPTHAALMELKAERLVVREAYDFLDEKRLLLAAELLRQLQHYQRLLTELEEKTHGARQRLGAAVKRHGLEGLAVFPAPSLEVAAIEKSRRNLMGVTLVETALQVDESPSTSVEVPGNPSLEAQQCHDTFRDLIHLGAELAGVSGNLYRLFAEYRRTERRARALENILLPEIEGTLGRMSAYLEEIDLEDAIRARPRK